MDPVNDESDIWFAEFLASKADYEFKVDIDEIHGKGWTVFANNRIEDEEGHLLGVGGVGVTMTNLQKLLEQMQEKYGIRIYLVNDEGMIQVSVEGDDVKQKSFDEIELSRKNKDYHYQEMGDGYVVTRYMDNRDFYLVVQKESFEVREYFHSMISRMLHLILTILAIALLCMGVVIHVGNLNMAKKGRQEGLTELSTIYDAMYLINLKEKTAVAIKTSPIIEEKMGKSGSIVVRMYRAMSELSGEEYKDDMIEFTNIPSLSERMKGMRTISRSILAVITNGVGQDSLQWGII